MKQPDVIAKSASSLQSMQYATLLRHGIAYCQELGGDLWTDFNEHDPGVTILEQLCYAITEASFRADLPPAELLAANRRRDSLVQGARILSTAPVTAGDYRKLLYDRVTNLKNAWLVTRDSAAGPLYHVRIETHAEENQAAGADRQRMRDQVRDDVRKVLLAQRNLGEDFDTIALLEPCLIEVHATIEVDWQASPTDVLAQVLMAIHLKLVPFPQVALLRDKIAAQLPYDAIFAGPLLAIGIIDDDQLGNQVDAVTVEQVAGLVSATPGVAALHGLTVKLAGPHGPSFSSGKIAIPPGSTPQLSPSPFMPLGSGGAYHIRVEREGVTYPIEQARVHQRIGQMWASKKNAELLSQQQMLADPYHLRPRAPQQDLGSYYSIQHQFPQTYGLGQYGVALAGGGGPAQKQRLMQARQLKAYLLFFEQVLADCFSQVGNLWQLFALDPALQSSYFARPLVDAKVDQAAPPNVLEWDLLARGPAAAPAPAQHFVVYLTAGPGHPEILMRSREVATLAQARALRHQTIELGSHSRHYRVAELLPGQYQVILEQRHGGAVGFSRERFGTRAAAEHEVLRLAGLLHAIARDAPSKDALLKITPKGLASVFLVDAEGRRLLGATHLTTEQQGTCVNDLLAAGVHAASYRIRALDDGDFRLYLAALDNRIIAEGEERYASHDDAHLGAKAIAALVAGLGHDGVARRRHLQLAPPAPGPAGDPLDYYRGGLRDIAARLDNFQERRNRFLDHLLARFGERFDDTALASFDPRLHGQKHGFYADLIHWKLALLRHCASLGSGRNRAWDYRRRGSLALAARSGLELRLFCLLGLLGCGGWDAAGRGAPAGAPPFRYGQGHAPPPHAADGTGGAHGRHGQPGQPGAHGDDRRDFFTFCGDHPDLFEELLKHGILRNNYSVAKVGRRYEISFSWPGAKRVAVHVADSADMAQREIERLMAYFGNYLGARGQVYVGEELVLLEHVLLRPARRANKADPVGRADPAQTSADDFYAFRISLFFPAWPLRFQNPVFRQFAARTVAQNCPAHLAVDCLWLEAPRMARFKHLHSDWMGRKHAVASVAAGAAPQADVVALDRAAARLRRLVRQCQRGGA